jgi:serine/threonine-protein kinase
MESGQGWQGDAARQEPGDGSPEEADTRLIGADEATQDAIGPATLDTPSGTLPHSAAATRALRNEERARARGFSRVIGSICVIGLSMQPFLEGPLWLKVTLSAGLIACGTMALFTMIRITSTPQPARLLRGLGVMCVLTVLVAEYYAGVFSPAPILIPLGLSFFGLSDDRRFGTLLCVTAAAGYFVLAGLVMTHVLPDYSLFPVAASSLVARVVALVIVISVFGLTFWQARFIRAAKLEAIERLDEAQRGLHQREALLEEANQNLDVALEAGARRPGAFTGARAGSYVLGGVIGQGGMGEVYAAQHAQSGASAAVKLLAASASSTPDLLRRFVREAEIAARVRSPHLVEVREVGQLPNGVPFLAMERLEGHDLGWLLRRRRQLPLEEVVELARQVAQGLDVVHASNVVHRDLKPSNIFAAEKPGLPLCWKLLDFGVAKPLTAEGTMTRNALVGTPSYMAPEQAQGHPVDRRSDIFSLGAVLYRALVGRPPFRGPEIPQILHDVVYSCPARPSEIVSTLPADVDLVLAIALAKHRDGRFSRAGELAEALVEAAASRLPDGWRQHGAQLLADLPWGATRR